MPHPSGQLFVRGTTVEPAVRYVKRSKGAPGWDGFEATLTGEPRALLDSPVRKLHWYDLADYDHVIETAARHLGADQPERYLADLGRFVLDDGVGTLYRAFFAIASPTFVIRGSAMLWGLFFKGSRLVVEARDKRSVHVAIRDAVFCSRALCVSIRGGMESSLEHAGARGLIVDEHRCRSEGGGSRCDFRFSWR